MHLLRSAALLESGITVLRKKHPRLELVRKACKCEPCLCNTTLHSLEIEAENAIQIGV